MLESVIRQFTVADWTATRDTVLPAIHEVDRSATRIWFYFFPLAVADAYAAAEDANVVNRRLRIYGNARLSVGQIDSSHSFLYGHRYWSEVKRAIVARTMDGSTVPSDLTSIVRELAAEVATLAHAGEPFVLGITFVGLMTLRQVGLEAFRGSDGAVIGADSLERRSPAEVLAGRGRDDGQGALGFLRSTKRFSVAFDERRADGRFPILANQHLTTAAADDKRDYTKGPRGFQEGPIPAECRSATCGTCWVGVLGGQDKLSEIEPDETKRLTDCGYIAVREPRPIIRLACQARAFGNVTIVIPPWHGVISQLYKGLA